MNDLSKKLKIGLLVNDLSQKNFNGEIIEKILNNKKLNIDTVIINKKINQKKKIIFFIRKYSFKRLLEKVLFLSLTIFEKILFILFFKNFSFKKVNLNEKKIEKIYVNPIESHLGTKHEYSDEDLKKIKNRKLDLILRLEGKILKGKILKITKNGVISFHHADNDVYRGLPPGFWEVFYRNPTTGFIIQKLNEDLDGGDVLFKGHIPTKFFYYYNKQFVYKQSANYINLVLEKFSNIDRLNYLNKKEYNNRIFKDPNLSELFKYIFSIYSYIFLKIIRKLTFSKEVWNIAFYKGKFDKKNLEKFNIIKNRKNRFIADPFVIKAKNKNYIFVEDYSFKNKKGFISCYEIDNDREKFLGKVVEEDFHLSFPFLFRYEEKLYMCPETHEKNEIRIYECLEFPIKWQFLKTLKKNICAVDTLLFQKNSLWWLLTNTDNNNINSFSELSIFYSDEGPLTNNWKPHKKNPVIVDANIARNGGLILDNDLIYRVNQKVGFNTYGREFDINLIKSINENDFIEEKIDNIKPNFFKNIYGTHHMVYNEDYCVVDFVKRG